MQARAGTNARADIGVTLIAERVVYLSTGRMTTGAVLIAFKIRMPAREIARRQNLCVRSRWRRSEQARKRCQRQNAHANAKVARLH